MNRRTGALLLLNLALLPVAFMVARDDGDEARSPVAKALGARVSSSAASAPVGMPEPVPTPTTVSVAMTTTTPVPDVEIVVAPPISAPEAAVLVPATLPPLDPVWTTPAVCADLGTYVTAPLPAGFGVSCSESYGYSSFNGSEIRLIWRDDMTVGTAACLYAHELGHAYDYVYLTDSERGRYAEARGYPAGEWTEERADGSHWWWWDGQWGNGRSAGEDWADSFATAVVPNQTQHYCVRSYGGDDLTDEQLALLWNLVN